jgi:hypothetical protein
VRLQRGDMETAMALVAVVLVFVLFSGEPSIAESLRVMAAKFAGLVP